MYVLVVVEEVFEDIYEVYVVFMCLGLGNSGFWYDLVLQGDWYWLYGQGVGWVFFDVVVVVGVGFVQYVVDLFGGVDDGVGWVDFVVVVVVDVQFFGDDGDFWVIVGYVGKINVQFEFGGNCCGQCFVVGWVVGWCGGVVDNCFGCFVIVGKVVLFVIGVGYYGEQFFDDWIVFDLQEFVGDVEDDVEDGIEYGQVEDGGDYVFFFLDVQV